MRTSTTRFSLGLAASAAVSTRLPCRPEPADAGQEPFIGELMLVPYTFCPRNYAEADGRLVAINQNQALFSLLGTNYGGDGRTTLLSPTCADACRSASARDRG